jgi:hypothetical protein
VTCPTITTNSTAEATTTFNGNQTVTISGTVSGFGLRVVDGSVGSSITVLNNGAVSTNQNRSGLGIFGNGGLITYSGNGGATTTGVSTVAGTSNFGLAIFNNNNGGVNIGSVSAPVTGIFSGGGGIFIGVPGDSSDQFNGNQNVFLRGGSVTATDPGTATALIPAIFLDALSGSGSVSITTTGGTVINPNGAIKVVLLLLPARVALPLFQML